MKKDPQPIEPKSREEFVKRLKEISKEPIVFEKSLGAMCYVPFEPVERETENGKDDSLPWGCWFIIIAIVILPIIIVLLLIFLLYKVILTL